MTASKPRRTAPGASPEGGRTARDFGGRRGSVRSTAPYEGPHRHDGPGRTTSRMALMLLFLAAVVLIVVPQITGSRTYTLMASPLVSTYPPGTFLVVQPTALSQFKHGDTVTFQLTPGRPEVGTASVVGFGLMPAGEQTLITKAANNHVLHVHARQIEGKLLYGIPFIGYLAHAVITADRDLWLAVGAGCLMMQVALALILVSRRRRGARGITER